METVYTGFTAMFEVGVTNIEDARPDSNKSRFITLPVYIYGVAIQLYYIVFRSHEIGLCSIPRSLLFDIYGSLVRRMGVVFYNIVFSYDSLIIGFSTAIVRPN